MKFFKHTFIGLSRGKHVYIMLPKTARFKLIFLHRGLNNALDSCQEMLMDTTSFFLYQSLYKYAVKIYLILRTIPWLFMSSSQCPVICMLSGECKFSYDQISVNLIIIFKQIKHMYILLRI